MSGSKKANFKTLLTKTSSNPTVNLQAVRMQRERLQTIRAGPTKEEPPNKMARKVPSTTAGSAPSAPETTVAAPTTVRFTAAGMFAGRRPGFVYKLGSLGLGYYWDDIEAQLQSNSEGPAVAACSLLPDDAGAAAGGEGSGGTLPQDFFDNPQSDPSNRGKEVAKSRKQQTLNDEFEEFTQLVTADLKAAEEVDIIDEEDEEEAKLHEAISVARHLEQKVTTLRQRVRGAGAASIYSEEAVRSSIASAADSDSHRVKEMADEEDVDDESEDQDALESLFDWRAKAV